MKTQHFFPAALSLLILNVPALHGQSIPNPGFETDTFTIWPGYAGVNGGISGWTFTGGTGLNPASGSPFADNGAVPQGNNVALIQSGSDVPATLGTTITGLTPGFTYVVRFRANQRAGYPAPAPAWSLNGEAFVPFSAAPAVGGSNGYYYVSGVFTATSTSAALVVGNQTTADTTLLVDDFTISLPSQSTSAWAVSPWTDDATSGISASTQWAWRFGSANNATINGATVTGVAGPNPAVFGRFIVSIPNVFPGDTNTVTSLGGSGSAEMAKNFIWGGEPAYVALEALTPGHTYVVSFFSMGWEAAGGRVLSFSSGAGQRVIDQDQYGDDNGLRADYTFVAVSDTRSFIITPEGIGTFHLYGLAVRQPLMVANSADSGTGSLRWAVATAAAQPGPDFIAFDPSLSGQTITLASPIPVSDPGGVTVDATTLPGGLTLGNSGGHRHFIIPSGSRLTLRGLSVVNGGGAGFVGAGGAILNDGMLTLTHCMLSGNSAPSGAGGGAVFNASAGTLTLNHCTLSGNSATSGGAIVNLFGVLTLTHCTLSGNSANTVGGAIETTDTAASLTHCTISGNASGSSGGGIQNAAPLILTNSIIAGNTTTTGQGADIFNSSIITRVGANIVGNLSSSGGTDGGPPAINGNPLLAPLANYGGPTQTMALRPGSPARNAAAGSTAIADQRAFPITGVADIGAYEAGTLTNCPAFLAESLPSTAPLALLGPAADFDNDGATNEDEWNSLTNPADAFSVFRLSSVTRSGSNITVSFPTIAGGIYTLWYSDTLAAESWIFSGQPLIQGDDAIKSFTINSPAGVFRRFFQIRVGARR